MHLNLRQSFGGLLFFIALITFSPCSAFVSSLSPSLPPPPIPNPVPDGVTPESYDAVIPPHPPECRGPYFRRAPCFLRPLLRLCSVSVCLFQVSKNKQEHKRNRRQSSGTDCEVERQRGRE